MLKKKELEIDGKYVGVKRNGMQDLVTWLYS